MIELAPGLKLPASAVTNSYALLAMKGAGKSNAAVVFAEQLFAESIPWVCIDPKGDWWGIRSSANGKGSGLAVPIFGGLHADVPIAPTAGKTFADLIVDQHLTCLIDVSELTKGESIRFLTAFFDQLYRRKNRATYPMHLFLEECDDYVPQMVRGEMAGLVHTVELCVKRGRQRGLGITLATQRSASVNKDVLTQTDTLIVLRTTSPQDRKAIAGWLNYHAGSDDILAELPRLQNGEAWVSSPQLDILRKVRFNRRATFDSGATPELGEKVKAATLADIDVDTITAHVADVVERAKADDPKTLRAEIVRLAKELDQAQRARVDEPAPVEVEVVHEVVPPEAIEALEGALRAYDETLSGLAALRTSFERALAKLQAEPKPHVTSAPIKSAPKSHPASAPRATPPTSTTRLGDNAPSKVLRAIVQSNGPITKKRAAALAGISPKSSTLRGALAELRRDGLIEGSGTDLVPTGAGRAAAGDVALPSGAELLDHWRAELGNGAPRQILDALVAHGRTLDKDELSDLTGISASSSTMRGALARLRSLGLVTGNALDPDFASAIA